MVKFLLSDFKRLHGIFSSLVMSLHRGLVWLADGFPVYDNNSSVCRSRKSLDSARCNPPNSNRNAGSGDGPSYRTRYNNIPKQPVSGSQAKIARVRSASHVRHQTSSGPGSARQRSHSVTASSSQSHRVKANPPYTERIRALRTESKNSKRPAAVHPILSNANMSVPENMTPRSGGWMTRPNSSGGRRPSLSSNTENTVIYNDLPTHPDLRYFDRHSRCFGHTMANGDMPTTRPSTACAIGKSSVKQCECCGEITSQLRYRYGPSGSAMTEMQLSNKTFLYPDKIMNYDSFTGRQRPCSAPSGSVSWVDHL